MGKKDVSRGQQPDQPRPSQSSRIDVRGNGNEDDQFDHDNVLSPGRNNDNDNNNNIFEQTFTSEPPPYSSPVANTSTSHNSDNNIPPRPIRAATSSRSTFPAIDFSKYPIPGSSLSNDGSTISTYHPSLSTNASNLVRFIQEQAALPPLPYIHLMGARQEGGAQRDFDIKINMLPLFMKQNNQFGQNSWNYVKLVQESELAYRGKNDPSTSPTVKGGLEEWAKRFCKETSSVKSFTLSRQLSNWNANYIEGQIRSLIASTGYDKNVNVTFPVKYAKVVVYPPKSSALNSFFTTLVSPLLDKKRFEVVRAVWPYASLPPTADAAAAAGRVPVVQSEEMWWEEWRDVLRWAIVGRRNGWVSIDDMLEFRMAPVAPQIPTNPWRW